MLCTKFFTFRESMHQHCVYSANLIQTAAGMNFKALTHVCLDSFVVVLYETVAALQLCTSAVRCSPPAVTTTFVPHHHSKPRSSHHMHEARCRMQTHRSPIPAFISFWMPRTRAAPAFPTRAPAGPPSRTRPPPSARPPPPRPGGSPQCLWPPARSPPRPCARSEGLPLPGAR